ncbi:MAG: argininosuccinate lyase [Candidatus Bathyarchaeia archaeon]
MRERLGVPPEERVVKYLINPRLQEASKDFAFMIQINVAHVIMLTEANIVSPFAGEKLLSALRKLYETGLEALPLKPELEDLYLNLESYIIDQLGPEIGGVLHTARSRNDLYETLRRMQIRTKILRVLDLLIALREALLKRASQTTNIVVTGYTHLQPAQPITFAHYFIALSYALERDTRRLFAAYECTNLCPLGAGALAGTSYPINRQRTAQLLGFSSVLVNTLDAVASRDYLVEFLSALANLGTLLSRYATDLYLWCTNEFGYIELPDSYAMTSSIMPQKKNPVVLEYVKAKAGHVYGALISALSCLKNTPFGHSRDIAGEAPRMLDFAVQETEAMLALLTAITEDLKIDANRALDEASKNFCTATDLADMLVINYGVPFRIAHQIIAVVLRECFKKGRKDVKEIRVKDINEVAKVLLGKELPLTDEDICYALDPVQSVKNRTCTGGTSAEQLAVMLNECETRLREDRKHLKEIVQALENAEKELWKGVKTFKAVN